MRTFAAIPVKLEGAHVRLEPLSLGHLDALCEVGLDEELWRWITVPVRTRNEPRLEANWP